MKNSVTNEPVSTPACRMSETGSAYVRGELHGQELSRFEKHLDNCPQCAVLVKDFTGVVSILADQPELETNDITAGVMAQIPDSEWATPEHKTRISVFPAMSLPAMGRAAALLVVGLSALAVSYRLLRDNISDRQVAENTRNIPADSSAIEKAETWLASVQEPEGSWDPAKWRGRKECRASLTGMALLALLGPGGKGLESYSENIEKGAEYLVAVQDGSGRFGAETGNMMYNHGIASYALLRIYRSTGNKALENTLERAILYIQKEQLPCGGWGYSSRHSRDPNTSVSSWQIRALQEADLTDRWEVTRSLHKGLRWLQSMVGQDGHVGYRRTGDVPQNSDTLTAMGVVCLLKAGENIKGLESTNRRLLDAFSEIASRSTDITDFYRSYFVASAIQASGRADLNRQLARIRSNLMEHRVEKGTGAGSWKPEDPWSAVGGALYSTSMAALSLQGGA